MRVCSLFCGIGGIDLAFELAGHEIVWANDNDKFACMTYRHNFPNVDLVEADIRSVDKSSIPDCDIVTAGFPCQPFSVCGKQPKLQDLVDRISDKPELSDEDFTSVVKNVYDLIPPYTYYHYRLLHEQIRDAAEKYYKDKNYYQAFYEAMKRYKNAVKEKANISESEDRAIVSKAFGKDAVLETTANHKYRPNGQLFDIQTIENIEEGQKFLSMGAVCGGRNVVSHEEISDLKEAGLFSEKDCLDLLSLLSHLFKRLDESKKRT